MTELKLLKGGDFPENIKQELIEDAAYALMKRWFPNRLPVGDDYEKWIIISLEDATAVVEHYINTGVIEVNK